MKIYLKNTGIWIMLSVLWMIYWILGLMVAGTFISVTMPESAADTTAANLMLPLISMLNVAVLMLFIRQSRLFGWRLVWVMFAVAFGLQYFLSQIETLWFNDALKMDEGLILLVVVGGSLSLLLWSATAAWVMGRFKKDQPAFSFAVIKKRKLPGRVALHAVIVWPTIYFLAGYFIAWQFAEVRQYYTGSEHMDSFFDIMSVNISSGLYFFQIFRGLIWIFMAFLIHFSLRGDGLSKALICGLLFSVIGSSQLLLPNPIMPEGVRLAHLLETGTSDFLWGFILSRALYTFIIFKKNKQ